MLTGRQLFAGETVSDVLAGVLKSTVDLASLPSPTPPAIRQLLRRCLERNPKNRLHDIADARLALDDAREGSSEAPTTAGAAARGRRWPPIALGALVLAAGIAAGWLAHTDTRRPLAASRWALALPESDSLSAFDTPQIALSRDGRLQAAVVAGDDGTRQLLLRRSDEFEPRFLVGAEGAYAPFFSPDGAWVAFFRDDALLKLPLAGGPPVRLATVVSAAGRGGTWSDDGFIYFAAGYVAGLSRVPATGGAVQAVTQLDAVRSERTHRWPDALAGGGAVLFTSDTQASSEYYDDARIEAVRPSTGERTVLVEGSSQARFAPGGRLVFARGGSLFAVAVDPRTLQVHGNPTQVAEGVATNVGSGAVQFALAESGAALWAPGGLSASYATVWVDRSGRESPVAVPQAPYQELALSPDGTRLALVGGPGGVSDLWIADLARGGITRLTSGQFVRNPEWTPDGTRVAFIVLAPGAAVNAGRIDWQRADGSRAAETLVPDNAADLGDFTRDGRTLLYSRATDAVAAVSNLWTFDVSTSRAGQVLPEEGRAARSQARLSPDGRWLAYVSDESGQDTVYVRPFPHGEGRWQVSIPGGDEPRWGPGGREIFYRYGSVLYHATIDTSSGFKAGRPQAFLDRVASGQLVHTYALAPDHLRIVTQRTAEGSRAPRVLYLDLGFASRLGPPGS
jgi:hypothetical protein